MPTTHRGRPPGRLDGRRPPNRGHAVPRRLTRSDVRAMLPQANAAIDYLNDAGQSDFANAVRLVSEYAARAADQAEQKAKASDEAAGVNRPVDCTKELHDHYLQASTAAGKTMTQVVEERFTTYLAGKWTPVPPPRVTRGTFPERSKLNVRVKDDLWNRVKERAQNPALNGGQKLTPQRVLLAALRAEFGLPDSE